jgi:WD40 repeat protein
MRILAASLALLAVAADLPPGAVARLGTTDFRIYSGRSAAALSPDGTKLAEVGTDDAVAVRDLTTGRITHTIRSPRNTPAGQKPGTGAIAAAFAPDGKHVLTSDKTDAVRVWDAATGKHVRDVPLPATLPNGVAFGREIRDLVPCPAANRVLVRAETRVFHLNPADWSWKSMDEVSDDITAVSADGNVVVTHYNVEALYQECWTVRIDGRPGAGALVNVNDGAWHAALSTDGQLVAAAGWEVRLFDTRTQKYVTLEGGKRPLKGIIRRLRFSPDAKTLFATSDNSPVIARWDTATGKRLPELVCGDGYGGWFDLTPDGKTLVSVGGDGVIRVFDAISGKLTNGNADGFSGELAVAVSADGSRVAVGDRAGMLRLWDAPFTGKPITLRATGTAVDALELSADGKRAFVAHADRTLGVWDVAAGTERVLKPPPGDFATTLGYDPPTYLAVSPDGTRAVAVLNTVGAWAWDVTTGRVLWEKRPPADAHKEVGNEIAGVRPAFTPDGKAVWFGMVRGAVGRFDAESGKEQKRILLPEAKLNFRWDVRKLALSPDGSKLLAETNYNDGRLRLIDLRTEQVVWQRDFKHAASILGLTFAGAGGILCTNADGQMRVIDAATGGQAAPNAGGHGYDLRLSADGSVGVGPVRGSTALVWKRP